ncbi:peptidylprolyl isomerase fpr3 [Tilletia horrida]|uniref:peptidylprolyl isomerase n=1 Tax=Tilletia horrida TaxID=155126 RepID=A0AAN6GFS1_9BASI|nr:peptidylprolyl isomerase fpr3 [Tilletia horrida]
MAAPPLSLFALRVPAGGVVVHPEEVSFARDFTISSITYADELPEGAKPTRSLVRVHHTPIIDHDDEDDDEDDDDDDDDDDEEEEDDDDDDDAPKANGAKDTKLALGKHEVDISTSEIAPIPEEQVHTICALVPNVHETVTGLNVHCADEDLVGFSVTGPYAVDLIGVYTANPMHMNSEPDSDEEIDSDIYGERSDVELDDDDDDEEDTDSDIYLNYEDDEDDDDDALDPALAGLLNPEDSGEEDALEDSTRFSVVDDSTASKKQKKTADKKAAATATPATATNGKKRPADAAGLDNDGDASMASAASDDKLSRNQRKRLNKKAKAQDDDAAAAAAAAAADESTVSTASAKAKKVAFKDGKDAPAAAAPAKADAGKKEKAAAPAAKAAAASKGKKTTTASGLIIEDVKVGTGTQAKPGQRVGMRYIGKLTNGKQFDANTSGKPFYFKLGRGEVIKGWDEGVKGMTIGSERRLTCPPQLAYGSRKLPDIPANSTLVFDVKLVDIKG